MAVKWGNVIIFAFILLFIIFIVVLIIGRSQRKQKQREKAVLKYLQPKPYNFYDKASCNLRRLIKKSTAGQTDMDKMSGEKSMKFEQDMKIYNAIEDFTHFNLLKDGYNRWIQNFFVVPRNRI